MQKRAAAVLPKAGQVYGHPKDAGKAELFMTFSHLPDGCPAIKRETAKSAGGGYFQIPRAPDHSSAKIGTTLGPSRFSSSHEGRPSLG